MASSGCHPVAGAFRFGVEDAAAFVEFGVAGVAVAGGAVDAGEFQFAEGEAGGVFLRAPRSSSPTALFRARRASSRALQPVIGDREIVQIVGNEWMVRGEMALVDRRCLFEQRQGVGEALGAQVQIAKLRQTARGIEVFRHAFGTVEGDGLLQQRYGLVELALRRQGRAEHAQGLGRARIRVFGPQGDGLFGAGLGDGKVASGEGDAAEPGQTGTSA